MKILLLGDYSNVHATLAQGLRSLGHEVVVASDGDGWKAYARDVDLRRKQLSFASSVAYYAQLWWKFRQFVGYDVVQLINPVFLPLTAERIWPFYRFLCRHNKHVFLGAYGMDHYWVKAGLDATTFRYSDFNLGPTIRESEEKTIWIRDWLHGEKGRLNIHVAQQAEGIIAGLYEYYASYRAQYSEKLHFIPFPIDVDAAPTIADFGRDDYLQHRPIRFFVGIQRHRSAYKGTDIMWTALQRVKKLFPDEVEVIRVENVPFAEYQRLLLSADVLLDQLYSYTPAMNALQAMAQGLVVVSGGEPENYDILHCDDLRPIVNVQPNEEDVVCQLIWLVKNKGDLPRMSRESRLYVERYHDHRIVAQQYVDFWKSRMNR